MRPQPPTNRNARNEPFVVAGHFYDKGQTDRYIASLKRRGIRGWQEARKLRTFRAAYGHAIAQVQDTAFQLGRIESERDEAVALLRDARAWMNSALQSGEPAINPVTKNRIHAFLTRIDGVEGKLWEIGDRFEGGLE